MPKEFQTQKELVKEIDASSCDLLLTDIDFAFEFPNLEGIATNCLANMQQFFLSKIIPSSH